MLLNHRTWLTCLLVLALLPAPAQRQYRDHSVLATGAWYKLGVTATGIYKIDMPLLQALGAGSGSIPSGSVRVFGNGGQMLPEANSTSRADDLEEIATWIEDGGDGMLNAGDYILFYAAGPHTWVKDSANQTFHHQRNLYAKQSYYFLTIGGAGRRVVTAPVLPAAAVTVDRSQARYFYELDTFNFLASGKEWYGEEFADAPGKLTSRTFNLTTPQAVAGSSWTLRTACIARSVGNASRFEISVNNQPLPALTVLPTGASQYDAFAQEGAGNYIFTPAATTSAVAYRFVPGSFNAQGWLNWIEWLGPQQLILGNNGQLPFRDWASVGQPVAEFVIGQATATTRVWEVTDAAASVNMPGTLNGSDWRFRQDAGRLREYIAFEPARALQPQPLGRIANQDLHAAPPADHIIIYHPSLAAEARRLTDFHHQHTGLRSLPVSTESVYNEFASGSPDPVAIRDFVKMYFDKYHQSPGDRLRYLLLLGDASYDYLDRLTGNTNLVPAYQNNFSLQILSSYATDDFYGFLEDDEDINTGVVLNDLDIGIGRVPAGNAVEAAQFIDKLEAYVGAGSRGPWRTQLTLVADDEDDNLHLQDAESVSATAIAAMPRLDQQKIYLDAYPQESNASGSRYPLVVQALDNQVMNGTLILNYSGHGGARRLAEESILDQEIVNGWNNPQQLPLVITATCDFAPYDNPLLPSLGENLLLRKNTGAIALMTTTRIVFSYSNRVMNNNYLRYALTPDADGRLRRLGDAVREAKNYTYQTSGDVANNRKFTLLGDPGLMLAFPAMQVRMTRLNGQPLGTTDTLRAGEKVVLEGQVTDTQGQLLSDFEGTVYPVFYDKQNQVSTLGNDPGSQVTRFNAWQHIIFKGSATVKQGQFSFSFKVPRDIKYAYGPGRLSLYAAGTGTDAGGLVNQLQVGGSSAQADDDKEGPVIRAYLNDEKFVNGSVTNERPVLLLKLTDSSGINTMGTAIGHDLLAVLDGDPDRYFVLNEWYQASKDRYQEGMVRFQLPELSPGPHQLRIRAWDAVNNSSEALLDFVVADDQGLTLNHVLNYPNPFTTHTSFWFEHNKPGQDLQVRLQIFTVSGRVIKMLQQTINTPGNRSCDLEWDGRDEYGQKVARGVYLYKLSVTAPGKQKKERIEKLVVF